MSDLPESNIPRTTKDSLETRKLRDETPLTAMQSHALDFVSCIKHADKQQIVFMERINEGSEKIDTLVNDLKKIDKKNSQYKEEELGVSLSTIDGDKYLDIIKYGQHRVDNGHTIHSLTVNRYLAGNSWDIAYMTENYESIIDGEFIEYHFEINLSEDDASIWIIENGLKDGRKVYSKRRIGREADSEWKQQRIYEDYDLILEPPPSLNKEAVEETEKKREWLKNNDRLVPLEHISYDFLLHRLQKRGYRILLNEWEFASFDTINSLDMDSKNPDGWFLEKNADSQGRGYRLTKLAEKIE